ncbi:tRNA-intron lyase [Candidatus Nanohalococcus occultus]|uniref:tRNA-intron lyase n=1 Tax=Candidatus Nanohalococcus occultus TaxID=2978047 RepID=UPI0039E0813B
MFEGKLYSSGVKVFDEDQAEQIHEEYYYGKFLDNGDLHLSPSEAMHLVDREEILIEKNGDELSRDELYDEFEAIDEEFGYKYPVYSDLRERGLIVKSGFKFGSHFRVYERGVNPYTDGKKQQSQHTKYVVHAVPENHTMSFQEMSRAVRLAQNIRASMLWGVVDSEEGVTYYEVEHTSL